MDYKIAVKKFKDAAGTEFIQPVESLSVCTRGSWFLVDDTGETVALVADRVLFGERLVRWYRRRRRASGMLQEEISSL